MQPRWIKIMFSQSITDSFKTMGYLGISVTVDDRITFFKAPNVLKMYTIPFTTKNVAFNVKKILNSG